MSAKPFFRVEWNETFRTRRDPFAPQEIFELLPGNFGWMDHAPDISESKILCTSILWFIIASIFEGKHYTTILKWFATDVINWITH